ncbi:hypothetical protein Q4E93_07280 [Flavitalea sp. BT771]|uniref:hypothetical protein n=1 Tax=Flavitalea sp. BT771 TaxID=3063329 RepID=UPI0026E45AC3|nr:hypothetical protein [Flavitalea sp. BT771]MDO6430381.1 hypothetical protein [Flavitalea sp. BT771]MDV6219479.1 hypothetical protein [Flavitalea sp. BT771]
MTPLLRKLVLLTHIITAVGWPGAVAGFLALAVTGVTSANARIVSAVYVAMTPVTWYVIVPLAFASLLTGVFLSLGTKWGLFRHYWVLAKFLINALSIVLLLLHTRVIGRVATVASKTALSGADLREERVQLVVSAVAALLALLAATILSVYKPRGRTSLGE